MANLFANAGEADMTAQWLAQSSKNHGEGGQQELLAAALASGNVQFLGNEYEGSHQTHETQ